MNTEEQIKGAIVVYPEAIVYASPELNHATELACNQLNKFVDYIQTLDAALERYEAIVVGAAILQSLPIWFEDNPDIVAAIKADCQAIRANRQ
ncbi:hypothetical protein [Nostoc sp. 'Peltigera malacea cyanobiont' DB3992]|uniref:hypothetical protein n=1 Tax=Nostoc sp. 'Peltigera malacea cyanobiont' DB3992 TaxID=1206980 RepID=UPI000C05539D|nr:hypothetical protein [Nostoc sp. 'Peltigera malacea cyanobiont' DB3992]PHM11642.1 hypothetical protein CK516_01500 [Nostoc sp. 'Peltigera malacea cyanobiont' DB3992]